MKYTVYLRTNKINGKQYVGQTNNFERRNNQFKSLNCCCNKYLDQDRIKFGVDNFYAEILTEVETREEALKLEQRFIKDYDTIFPNGYNVACGGKNNTGCGNGLHNGKEFEMGNEPWNKGIKNCFSKETIEKMSERQKGKRISPSTEFKKGITPWIKGKHHSEEAKEKNRQAHCGKISKKRMPILQFTLDWKLIKEFTHCDEAAKELGFKTSESIRKACKEEWRTSGGFRWKYKDEYMNKEFTNE